MDEKIDKKEESENVEILADVESTDVDTSKDSSSTEEKTDYKAIAETEKARADKAEGLIVKDKKISKRHKEDGEDEVDPQDKPITQRQLNEALATTADQTRKAVYGEQIKDIASSIAETAEEAEAIIEFHKNRSFPNDLSIREQLEEVQAIVNRKVNKARLSEAMRAKQAKGGVSKDGSSTHRDPQVGRQPKISAADAQALREAGYTYAPSRDRYEKKLPTGVIRHIKKLGDKPQNE